MLGPVATPAYHIPTVVRIRKKITGEIVQACDIYIGRRFTMAGWDLQESLWMNPFKCKTDQERANSLIQYEQYIRGKIAADPYRFLPILRNIVSQGRPLTLGCWCAPKACHGDVIIKLLEEFVANGMRGLNH